MLIFDSIGFGSAFALLVPFSYAPDIAFDISGVWYAAPSIIIIFYFLNILGQFISSSTRKKEEYSKKHVLLWGIVERLGFILIFLSLKFFLDSQIILPLFFITYAIFVYSAGAILPAYFDLVSRVLYKLRAIFFAANLTMGSLAGFLVSRYVDIQIQSEGLVEGFLDGLLIVIIVTSISLIPLGLIREPKDVNQLKSRLSIKNIYKKLDEWYEIYKSNKNIKVISQSNIVSSIPESMTPFFTIWLIGQYELGSEKIGIWVTLLLISQSLGSFFVPIVASKIGFKFTYIFGLIFHTFASLCFIVSPVNLQNYIFIFAGLGLGTFFTSQSNIAVEVGNLGDAGNTNAMLTVFRLPGLLIGPFVYAYFVDIENIIFFLILSLVSSTAGGVIMFKNMKIKILPQIRFWAKDT